MNGMCLPTSFFAWTIGSVLPTVPLSGFLCPPMPIFNPELIASFPFRAFYLIKAMLSLSPGNHVVHFLPEYSKTKLISWVILFMPTLTPQTPEHLSVNVSDLQIFDWLVS